MKTNSLKLQGLNEAEDEHHKLHENEESIVFSVKNNSNSATKNAQLSNSRLIPFHSKSVQDNYEVPRQEAYLSRYLKQPEEPYRYRKYSVQKTSNYTRQRKLSTIHQVGTSLDYANNNNQTRINQLIYRKKNRNAFPKILNRKSVKTEAEYTVQLQSQYGKPSQKIVLSNFMSSITRQDNRICYQYQHASFYDLYLKIPQQIVERNQENVRLFAYRCYKFNPLLKKLQYLSVVEFIKHSNILVFKRNQYVYDKNSPRLSSYIVLWGKVQINNQYLEYQQFGRIGSTLNEDYFMEDPNIIKRRNETCKALQNTGIMQLTQKCLNVVKNALVELHLRRDLVNLQSVFKRNYLSKQSQKNHRRYRYYDE